jgi:hypothetical protein
MLMSLRNANRHATGTARGAAARSVGRVGRSICPRGGGLTTGWIAATGSTGAWKKLAVAIISTAFQRSLQFLCEVHVRESSKVPKGIFVNADLTIDVTKHVLVGSIEDGEGKFQFHLEGGESEFLQLPVFGVQSTREGADAFLILVI